MDDMTFWIIVGVAILAFFISNDFINVDAVQVKTS